MKNLSLLDLQPDSVNRTPELIRLTSDEFAVVPFTDKAVAVDIHFVDSPAINSYVRCNGPNCDLCRIGKTVATKFLLPVYRPLAHAVGILPISDNPKPGALRPQIIREVVECMKGGKKRVVFIKKIDNVTFSVQSTEIPESVEDGAEKVKDFLERMNRGEIDMASVYPSYTNDELRQIEDIREQLRLRGLI